MPEIVGFGGTASAPNQWIARPAGHVGEAVVPPPHVRFRRSASVPKEPALAQGIQ
jgi:hypothetical protein